MEPAPTLPEPDLLERLVTLIDASVAPNGWHHNHILIKVEDTDDPEAFDLGFKDLPDDVHPVSELWGFRAPPSWRAIGVVTYGWAGPMGDVRPSLHQDRRRVRLTVIIDRDGREAATASLDDGTVIDEPGEGRLGDVLRCALGVPTGPPPPVEHLATVLWLHSVVGESERRRMSWARIESLHHAPEGNAATWAGVRRIAARSGGWPLADDWMDDGFFAREFLARLPSIDSMMATLAERLSPGTLRKLRGALRE